MLTDAVRLLSGRQPQELMVRGQFIYRRQRHLGRQLLHSFWSSFLGCSLSLGSARGGCALIQMSPLVLNVSPVRLPCLGRVCVVKWVCRLHTLTPGKDCKQLEPRPWSYERRTVEMESFFLERLCVQHSACQSYNKDAHFHIHLLAFFTFWEKVYSRHVLTIVEELALLLSSRTHFKSTLTAICHLCFTELRVCCSCSQCQDSLLWKLLGHPLRVFWSIC